MRFCILVHSLWILNLYAKKIEMGSKFLDIPLTIEWVGPSGCEEKQNCDDEGYSFISEAFSIAISTINNDQTVPFFQNLTIRYVDSMGKNTISTVAEACKMPKSLLIMGLSPDCMVESSIASYYTKFTITDNCMVDSKSLSGFEKTSLFLKPSVESISQSFIRLLQEFKWKNVALISPTNLEKLHISRRDQLKDRLIKSGVSVLLDSRYDVNGNKNYFVKKVEKDTAEARIFLIYDPTINLPLIRNFLYSLAELQLFSSGDYFVIGYFGFDSNREWVDQSAKAKIFNIGAVSPYNISSASLPLLYRNALFFSDAPPPSSSNDQWKKLKTQIETKLKKENSTKVSFPYWDRVSRTMDGLFLWTKIGTEMLNVGLDITNGSIIYENMMDRKYKSVTGYDEYIDYNGFSLGSTIVYNFIKSIERGGEYGLWEVGRIGLHSDDNNIWYIDPICEGLVVNWINGIPPRDVPECGFKGELCIKPRDRLFIILICVVITVVCVLIVIAAILYRRYRFERRLHSLSFLIDRRDIVLKKHLNLLSMRSMRSMTSMRGSFMGSEIKNSHFLVEDYETRDPSNPVDSIAAIIDAGPLKDGEDPLDAKWNNLGEFAVGMHEGTIIAMKRIFKSDIDFTRGIRKEIITIQECSHENVLSFRGLICHPPNIFIVSEMANRGSLKDLLDNNELPLDDLFLNQMSKDIVQGLEYLHSSEVGCHGRLKSSNCLIDARWMVRLSSFGLAEMRANENAHKSEEEEARDDFWTAPELLRWGKDLTAAGSLLIKKADIYSLSILFYEIFGRCGPWGDEPMDPTEIIDRVRHIPPEKEAFRPDITLLKDCPAVLQETVSAGWAEDPVIRPGITHIRRKLKILTVGLKKTIMDSMVSMIEKYTTKLEIDINERNFELAEEKKKSEQLLKMMLPPVVAESLKNGNAVAAESFNSVTVFFSDCPGFVDLSATSKPIEIVQFLNDLYTLFDGIINRYDVYKVETIADAYMVVSGLPVPNGPHHAGEIASLGLALLQSVKSFTIRHRPEEKVKLRIGIHSGPCVAGVVGLKMPRYCLFGDTVNTASRMESNGIPLMINCSQTTRDILVQLKGFDIEERGMIEMKGKGLQMTYFVKGEDTSVRRERLIKERIKYPTLRNTAHSEELEALLLRM